ncbi:MAG TPA: aspartyl protease family protein [Rhizomicrobium sp.]|jgi:membrane-associated protease RseP (regulator of RpoE activity)|nr:aspartyl protease family protein [Rhizomicrobium sp.]
MRIFVAAIAPFALAGTFSCTMALAAPSAAEVLDANRAAMGNWNGKATLRIVYAYSGQGLTGKVTSLDDLGGGNWTDDVALGPATQSNGYDGHHAWEVDPSHTVTLQDGGEQRALAVNESFRRANLWWRPGFDGATVVFDGEKPAGGERYDVLTVTPTSGKNFDAWFDATSHLLARTIEQQGPQTVTTIYSDYEPTDRALIAHRVLINNGDSKYDQNLTVTGATFLPAQPAAAFSAPKAPINDIVFASAAKETTFPIHLYNNHIYADVSVDGKGPYQFIFDTGGVNLLTPPLVSALGLKSEGQMEGNGTGSGHMDMGLTKVSSLQLGQAIVKNQVFAVMALNRLEPAEGVPMPGMVGYETFRRFVTRVDYGAGTMTLMRSDAFDPNDAGTPVPVVFDGNTIEAHAIYDGVTGKFTIDTGSRASLTFNGPFAAQNRLTANRKNVEGITGWGVGGPSRGITMRGGRLEIGALAIDGPVAEISTDKGGDFSTAAIAGNIGAGILKRYIVTLDYEHSMMYLKPSPAGMADLDTFDRAGMWINQSDAGYKVIDVTKGAPADTAGLKPGNEIVAVNGKAAASIPLYEMRRQLRDDAPGTVVTFSVRHGNKRREIAVTLRDLI